MKNPNRVLDPRKIQLHRRNFLKLSGLTALMLFLMRCAGVRPKNESEEALSPSPLIPDKKMSPIQEISGPFRQKKFTGDDPLLPHRVLWQLDEELKNYRKLPVEKSVKLTIIGGGASGLITAYKCRKLSPLILEQCTNFGGNARGETWKGMPFSLGSAYIAEPEEDSDLHILMSELGLGDRGRLKSDEHPEPLLHQKKIFPDLWSAKFDPGQAKIYAKVRQHFLNYLNEEDGKVYPNIPVEDSGDWKNLAQLDQRSFRDEAEKAAGGKLPAILQTAIEHYSWSSLGASAKVISAAAGVNFFAAELGEIRVYPAGNSSITSALYEKLRVALPHDHLRCGALVARVERADSGKYRVYYFDAAAKIHVVESERVVFACPKFIVRRIFPALPAARAETFSEIEYSSFLVGNVLLKSAPADLDIYGMYRMDEASGNFQVHGDGDIKEESDRQGATDMTWAPWPTKNYKGGPAVMTLYRPVPHAMGRTDLLQAGAYAQYKKSFQREVESQFLPALKISPSLVEDIRLTRWGHPLPIAKRGLYSNQRLRTACSTIDKQIYFANQDNWSLPAFEVSVHEALRVAKEIS